MDPKERLLRDLANKNQIKEGKLRDIHRTIAIDFEAWQVRYTKQDPYSKLLGGIPATLKEPLSRFIQSLGHFRLRPVFVMRGLPLYESLDLCNIWKFHMQGDRASFIQHLNKHRELPNEVLSSVCRLIRRFGGEVIRAPYLIGSQLAYLNEEKLVGGVYADIDNILYGTEHFDTTLILEINFEHGSYEYVQKVDVFRALKTSRDNLITYFLLNGYLFGRLLPNSNSYYTPHLAEMSETDKEYLQNTKTFIKSNIVISLEENLKHTYLGSIRYVMSQRLPDALYIAVFIFPLFSNVFTALSTHKMIEYPPLAFSSTYFLALKKLKPLRNIMFNILFSVLPREYYFSFLQVQWYSEEFKDMIEDYKESYTHWSFSGEELDQEKNRQNKENIDISFCLKWHRNAYKNFRPLNTHAQSSRLDVIIAKILLSFLQCKKYISLDKKPTVAGFVYSERTMLFVDLLMNGLIHHYPFSHSLDDEVPRPDLVLLVSRVFSLFPPTVATDPWTGELDYDLIQFVSIAKLVSSYNTSLLETLVAYEMLRVKPNYNIATLQMMSFLPNACHSHIGLGIAIKLLFKGYSLQEVGAKLPQLRTIKNSLIQAWEFWMQCLRILKFCVKHKSLDYSVLEVYTRATSVLKGVFKRSNILNNH